MKPKYVVYECENCGKLFYRNVAEVLTDDVDDCHVRVELVNEYGTEETEEFPMCACIGGDVAYVVPEAEAETPSED